MTDKITFGEPCCPYTVSKVSIVNGEVVRTKSEINGRKIPLHSLRRRLLSKQEKLMRLQTNSEIDALSPQDIESNLSKLGVRISDQHYEQYKELQRTRTLVLWHDHSSILGHG